MPMLKEPHVIQAERLHQEILRKMSFARKWEQVCSLRAVAWNLKAARLRSQHPEWFESQIQETVREMFLYGST